MKKLLVLIVVIGLAGAVEAGVTNPEGFEGYSAGAWAPTQAGQGWTLNDRDPMSIDILATGSHDGSQALHVVAPDAGDGGGYWYATAPAEGVVTLSMDMKMNALGVTYGQGRFWISLQSAMDGNPYSGFVFERNDGNGNRQIKIIGTYGEQTLPGFLSMTDADYLNTWYTFEIILDYGAGTMQGRFGPVGGAMNAWSDTMSVDTSEIAICELYSLNGEFTMDNFLLSTGQNPGVRITELGGTTNVDEDGPTTDSYTIVLTGAPTAPVTITIDPNGAGAGTGTGDDIDLGNGAGVTKQLIFTAGDWDLIRTVNVTAVDDSDREGSEVATITHTAVSADSNYNNIEIDAVAVQINDNDYWCGQPGTQYYRADVDGDCNVNLVDMAIVAEGWRDCENCSPDSDVDKDGFVNMTDIEEVGVFWLECTKPGDSNCFEPLLVPGSYTIICFGDSTTEVAPEHGIVYQENLTAELPGYGITGNVINAGVSGNKTNQGMARFNSDILSYDPDLVIIQFGLNDSAVDSPGGQSRIPLSEFISNMTYFTQTLKTQGSKVILMTTNAMSWTSTTISYAYPPYVPGDPWGLNAVVVFYNQAVRDIAIAEDVPLVDVYQMYVDYDAVPAQDFNDLLDDGVHPNTAGHRLTTDGLIEVITGVTP